MHNIVHKNTRYNTYFTIILITVCVVLIDRLSKTFIVDFLLSRNTQRHYVFSWFNIVSIYNPGISFGIFGQSGVGPWPFTIFSLIIVFTLNIYYLRQSSIIFFNKKYKFMYLCAIGLVCGGAISNVADRFMFGAVFDFLDFHIDQHHYPAFNIADTTIVFGTVCLMLLEIFSHHNNNVTTKTMMTKQDKIMETKNMTNIDVTNDDTKNAT